MSDDLVAKIDEAINTLHSLGWHLDTADDYIKIYQNPKQFEVINRSILTTLEQAISYAKQEKLREELKHYPKAY